eukprot:Gregarina_sp_Poly_1__2068@NODE_1544_length_3879_cov_29_608342_g1019_i0_p2_GENE_NODE_1544_length_3879_cov_29_608342_g1019_i0NODE_1544_length_3879_cov_29_608342_g1019_i0_p2_ORF_typecomplete_len318_score22_78TauE/PF01925_19/6_6TauE/PF01925_19/2_9_NODE_1544_length_3879_cov_29_608342_g1019_i018662819
MASGCWVVGIVPAVVGCRVWTEVSDCPQHTRALRLWPLPCRCGLVRRFTVFGLSCLIAVPLYCWFVKFVRTEPLRCLNLWMYIFAGISLLLSSPVPRFLSVTTEVLDFPVQASVLLATCGVALASDFAPASPDLSPYVHSVACPSKNQIFYKALDFVLLAFNLREFSRVIMNAFNYSLSLAISRLRKRVSLATAFVFVSGVVFGTWLYFWICSRFWSLLETWLILFVCANQIHQIGLNIYASQCIRLAIAPFIFIADWMNQCLDSATRKLLVQELTEHDASDYSNEEFIMYKKYMKIIRSRQLRRQLLWHSLNKDSS